MSSKAVSFMNLAIFGPHSVFTQEVYIYIYIYIYIHTNITVTTPSEANFSNFNSKLLLTSRASVII